MCAGADGWALMETEERRVFESVFVPGRFAGAINHSSSDLMTPLID